VFFKYCRTRNDYGKMARNKVSIGKSNVSVNYHRAKGKTTVHTGKYLNYIKMKTLQNLWSTGKAMFRGKFRP
jgi:hypothetical protein